VSALQRFQIAAMNQLFSILRWQRATPAGGNPRVSTISNEPAICWGELCIRDGPWGRHCTLRSLYRCL